MNKKTKIQLAIILVCFGAAAIVLYNGLYGVGPVAVSPGSSGGPALTPQSILPYGSSNLDFSVLNSHSFVFNQLQFPQLNPASDVGVTPDNMISGAAAGGQ